MFQNSKRRQWNVPHDLAKSVDEVFADDRRALRQSTFPSADCLDPWEAGSNSVVETCLRNG